MINILRLVAILAVILIHTTTRTLEVTKYDLVHTPWTLFLNQASRFAVPLFFLLSGFVLELNYAHSGSYLVYLKKRLNRLFIPYVFWSAIYYFLVYTRHRVSFLSALATGDASYQLYFIPALLIFYLLFPAVHAFVGVLANRWVLLILGGLQILLLSYDYYVHPLPFYYPVSTALLNFFVFLLGVVAVRHHDPLLNAINRCKYVLFFVALILVGYIFCQGATLYFRTHNNLYFYSQWRPSVLLYTLSLSGLLYYFFSKAKISLGLVKPLSDLSFLVFFIHVIVLEVLWNHLWAPLFQLTGNQIARQLWYDPLYFLLTTVVSFLIAFVIHRFPLLAKLTG